MTKHKVFLGLGSNMGNRRQNLRDAVRLIEKNAGRVVRHSSVMESEPWGYCSDSKYLNAVVMIETTLTPHELLAATQRAESEMGRTRKSTVRQTTEGKWQTVEGQYSDRPIDIDILLYDDLQLTTPELTIPHPRMEERDFVMIPLREITGHNNN